jgi:RNase P subunit RPR2
MQSREAGKHVGKQSDALERINYLSQVSTFFAERGNQAIARKFNSTLVQIAKKQQVRVPVLVKQTICKSCFSNIDNRVNSSRIRIQRKRESCFDERNA